MLINVKGFFLLADRIVIVTRLQGEMSDFHKFCVNRERDSSISQPTDTFLGNGNKEGP